MSSTPLTDPMRAALKAAIPPVGADPSTTAETARWREVLVEEADRLASAQFPHEQVEPLLALKAAFWSESVLISGFADEPQAKWSIRAPITRRILPRSGFARAFSEAGRTSGPHIRVNHGHRIRQVHDAWFAAEAKRQAQVAEARAAFLLLIESAETLEEVEEAWPDARTIVNLPASRAEARADAAAKVRLLLGRVSETVSETVSDTVSDDASDAQIDTAGTSG